MLCYQICKYIIQALFPSRCLNCKVYTQKSLLCKSCFDEINIYRYFICPTCHKRIDFNNLILCSHPSSQNIKALLACTDYSDDTVKDLIHKFKYERFLRLTNIFDKIICQSLASYQDYFKYNNFLIIPVPLHWIKTKRRGFNQSTIIAKSISEFLNVPINDRLLIRYKNNPSQAKINDPILRQQNVNDIFKINENLKSLIKNKNIILVDDVFTTGSTLNECAKVLKQNGTNLIVAICLAR